MRAHVIVAACAAVHVTAALQHNRPLASRDLPRRHVLEHASACAWAGVILPGSVAAAAVRDDADVIAAVLADAQSPTRVADPSIYVRPTYGKEADDVYYPPWFQGTWDVRSRGLAVVAPAGERLFAPAPGALERARNELKTELAYAARWQPTDSSTASCICDRAYNVASIARASMGSDAVLGVGGGLRPGFNERASTADVLEARLRPAGAGGQAFRVLIEVLGRRSRSGADAASDTFECAEFVRQTVYREGDQPGAPPVPGTPGASAKAPPLVKLVETVNTYRLAGRGHIESRQLTKTYLAADAAYTMPTTDIATLQQARAAGSLAVDVRLYDVDYRLQS